MFSKAIFTSAVTLALAGQVFGHCAIQPQLGVQGNSTRNDVQRPSQSAECGTTNIAQTIDSSTAVPLDATNSFAATAVNFNAGQDGSTQVTALVDPTGTGNSFVAATVTKNGILAPTTVAPADLAITLPAGTTCTGGAAKNLCLVSFTTAGGFGNCVVVSQAAAGATAANATAATGATAANTTTTGATGAANTTTTGTTAAAGKHHGHHHHKGAKGAAAAAGAVAANPPVARRAVGTRAPRALLERINHEGEHVVGAVKRGIVSWIWA